MANDTKLVAHVLQLLIEQTPSLFDPAAKATARQFKDVIAPTSMEFAKLPRSLRTPPTNPAVEVMSSAPLPSDSKDLNLLTKIFKPPATKKRRYSKKKVAANQDQIEQTEPQKSPERNETEQTETPDKFQAQAVRTTTSASTQNEVVEDIPKKAPAGVNGICDFGEEGDSSDTSEPAPSKENGKTDMLIAIKGNKSDRQVAQVERACKSIVSHLYDAEMDLERARRATKNLRTLCKDIETYFTDMKLQIPEGNISDEEVVNEEQDEDQLLILLTQIKHYVMHVKAYTQCLQDAYERSTDETSARGAMEAFMAEMAGRLNAVASISNVDK